jgi:hypothetical protein
MIRSTAEKSVRKAMTFIRILLDEFLDLVARLVIGLKMPRPDKASTWIRA